jgi:FtsZ-binding cell division protein ZapB
MPPHSSYILQPLDVGCFGLLKQAYGRQIEDMMKTRITHITKVDFFPAFQAAFQSAMSEKNIQGGFRGTGLVPYDPESVLSRLDVKLRTPSPAEGDSELPNLWVPKTPNNPIEATSQTNFIKDRISCHQGSSPTSILAAMDQFAKGARGIMHQMALLKAEVNELREANATLSRRRRAKKTRLRHSGSMTVAEGQELQDQREIAEQIQQETLQSCGRKRRTETRERRCRRCRQPGHNARTCKADIYMSDKDISD